MANELARNQGHQELAGLLQAHQFAKLECVQISPRLMAEAIHANAVGDQRLKKVEHDFLPVIVNGRLSGRDAIVRFRADNGVTYAVPVVMNDGISALGYWGESRQLVALNFSQDWQQIDAEKLAHQEGMFG